MKWRFFFLLILTASHVVIAENSKEPQRVSKATNTTFEQKLTSKEISELQLSQQEQALREAEAALEAALIQRKGKKEWAEIKPEWDAAQAAWRKWITRESSVRATLNGPGSAYTTDYLGYLHDYTQDRAITLKQASTEQFAQSDVKVTTKILASEEAKFLQARSEVIRLEETLLADLMRHSGITAKETKKELRLMFPSWADFLEKEGRVWASIMTKESNNSDASDLVQYRVMTNAAIARREELLKLKKQISNLD